MTSVTPRHPMSIRIAILFLGCISLIASPLYGYTFLQHEKKVYGVMGEADMYNTNIEVYHTFRESTPVLDSSDETKIYWMLLKKAFFPNLALFEFGVYPMPCLGVYLKEYHRSLYDSFAISKDINLIHCATIGFDEPYAYSLFFGNIAHFQKKGNENTPGKAYMGYLLSTGDYHIHQDEMITTKWTELEWKIKGEFTDDEKTMDWSFRLGAKFFEHPEINDNFYISLKRNRIDFFQKGFSFTKNSSFEWMYRCDNISYQAQSISMIYGKSLVIGKSKHALNLSVGFVWEMTTPYHNSLKWLADSQGIQVVIRPQFMF